MNILNEIRKGVSAVLKTKRGLFWFLGLSIFIFWLLIMIPVWTTPGNDFTFQLEILGRTPALLAIVIVLSLANALLIAMQIYIKKQIAEKKKHGGHENVATISGVVLSILSTLVACSACYSAVFAVFGLGATAFLVKYRYPIATIALLVTIYAVYKAAKRINGNCEVCRLKINAL